MPRVASKRVRFWWVSDKNLLDLRSATPGPVLNARSARRNHVRNYVDKCFALPSCILRGQIPETRFFSRISRLWSHLRCTGPWVGGTSSFRCVIMTTPEIKFKTTRIPVKFDRQGHSCNFYAGFGPTFAHLRAGNRQGRVAAFAWFDSWLAGGTCLRCFRPSQRVSLSPAGSFLRARRSAWNDAEKANIAPMRNNGAHTPSSCAHVWILFGGHPLKLERYRED